MRRGDAAGFPHQQGYGAAQLAPHAAASGGHSAHGNTNFAQSPLPLATLQPAHLPSANHPSENQARANIARLFFDLRNTLRMAPDQVAAILQTPVTVVQALEAGQFEFLPPWPETSHVVMAYAGLAGIDGRPVLAALANLLANTARAPVAAPQVQIERARTQQVESQQVASQKTASLHTGHHPQVARLRQAGTAFANSAKRLPAGAIKQVRERPERAFYAVSLPLGIVLLLLNTSALQAAFDHVPRPVSRMAESVRQYFQVQFAPVREGLRWIEVDNPRHRRGDKLRPGGQSD